MLDGVKLAPAGNRQAKADIDESQQSCLGDNHPWNSS
jgi:hypothetical protein